MDEITGRRSKLVLDFYHDWIEFARNQLLDSGYTISSTEKPENIAIIFFNVLRRRIEPRPRKVFVAREFSCPGALKESATIILEKARRGDDLVPYQSRKLNLKKRAGFKDALLFHWDIHHLHLRPEGGSELLFVRVTHSHFYLVKFGDHKKWFDMDVLRILHRNWPESIQRFRAPESLHGDVLSERQINNLLRKNSNIIIPVEGVSYFPLGRGTVSAGFNIDTIIRCDYERERLRFLEIQILLRENELVELARLRGWRCEKPLHFQLQYRNGIPFCINREFGIQVNYIDTK